MAFECRKVKDFLWSSSPLCAGEFLPTCSKAGAGCVKLVLRVPTHMDPEKKGTKLLVEAKQH